MEVARELFARRGFDAVGLSELCGAMGINPPSFYSAFGNKLGLYERAVALYAATTGKFVADALDRAQDVHSVRREVLLAAARTYGAATNGCMVLDGQFMTDDDGARGLVAAHLEATHAAIAARLEELGAGDPEAETRVVMTMMRGLSVSARAGMSEPDLLAVAEAFVASDQASANA
ncbi:MAG: TetR/AcrR family transcriptional regulator [Shimia sp.]